METEKKDGKKMSKLVADEKTQKKAGELLDELLLKVQAKETKNPELEIIRAHIAKIDALQKSKSSLQEIFEHLNANLNFSIKPTTFVQYVRKIRKEVGSDFYTKSELKKKNAVAVPDVAAVTDVAAVVNNNVQQEEKFHCDQCKTCAVRKESPKYPGKFFWQCPACKSWYADENGNLTNKIIGGSNDKKSE